jgi:hypothetical protein
MYPFCACIHLLDYLWICTVKAGRGGWMIVKPAQE